MVSNFQPFQHHLIQVLSMETQFEWCTNIKKKKGRYLLRLCQCQVEQPYLSLPTFKKDQKLRERAGRSRILKFSKLNSLSNHVLELLCSTQSDPTVIIPGIPYNPFTSPFSKLSLFLFPSFNGPPPPTLPSSANSALFLVQQFFSFFYLLNPTPELL